MGESSWLCLSPSLFVGKTTNLPPDAGVSLNVRQY